MPMPPSPLTFAEFVEAHTPVANELPLVHTTRCELFKQLCSAGYLSPRDCPVFKEPLLYFFYGRPAYRSKLGGRPDTLMNPMPICFVFKPGAVGPDFKRVFPFDSGAASAGMFVPHVEPGDLLAYSLPPNLATIRKAISAFFETNDNYFFGTPRSDPAAANAISAIGSYRSLLNEGGPTHYDDRRSAIEVQSDQNLILRNNVHAVVLPTPFLKFPDVRHAIVNEWRATPIRYSHFRGTVPNEYVRIIAEKVETLLTNGEYI